MLNTADNTPMWSHEQLLQAEIQFWQEMIAVQPADGPALVRMHQALALAERKLALLRDAAAPVETPEADTPALLPDGRIH